MNFSKQQIADACRRQASGLSETLLAGYDPAQLLWAICGNESSFGVDCTPRHEPAFDAGGTYAQAPSQLALLKVFGSAGACSYGPMQVMLVNAPEGYTPASFDDVDLAVAAGAYALNCVLARWKPQTMAQVGACYNAGHIPKGVWPDGVHAYATELMENYATPLSLEVMQG